MLSWLNKWLRRRVLHDSLVAPEQWSRVEEHMPFLGRLADGERQQLRRLALQFLGEKALHGAGEFSLTLDDRLSIALQACLPVLHLGLDWYDGWAEAIVYPGEFLVPRSVVDEDGIVHEYDDVLSGEAWEGGPVVLSWPQEGDLEAGVNVVIHEFVHKLDMLNGVPSGLPPLHEGMSREAWARDFSAAFEDFLVRLDNDGETPLDPYAGEHPAEFFAVASEAFFVDPQRLFDAYPAVYSQLTRFYRQEPLGRNVIRPGAAE